MGENGAKKSSQIIFMKRVDKTNWYINFNIHHILKYIASQIQIPKAGVVVLQTHQ